MKNILGLVAFLATLSIALGQKDGKCAGGMTAVLINDPNWEKNMIIDEQNTQPQRRTCTNDVRRQIKMEISASIFYLSMGAYFAQDDVNRPGFANFFFGAAKEEREHASHLIDYLTMRGETKINVVDQISAAVYQATQADGDRITTTRSGKSALEEALKKELTVTESIKKVIKSCELDPNDYHIVDYLTGVYLEEQYKGQRELAGRIATLTKMMDNHRELGEFMFDKTLL